jgi:hypothetical protein
MIRSARMFALVLAASLALLGAGRAAADGVVVYSPSVSYSYAPPAVAYYTPPVVVAPAPRVAYYYTPAMSYYPPAVTYYAPSVSYYAPATTVTTARYGPFGRLRGTTTYYYPPAYVSP